MKIDSLYITYYDVSPYKNKGKDKRKNVIILILCQEMLNIYSEFVSISTVTVFSRLYLKTKLRKIM